MGLKLLINSLFRGGAEKQFMALAKALPHDDLFLLENEIDQDIGAEKPIPLSGHTAATPSIYKTAHMHSYAKKLAARTSSGDTVLSFMERANMVNILAARKSGHRAVICERTRPSGEFSGLRGTIMKPLIRKLYPEAGAIIANSEGVKKDLRDNFSVPEDKIKVIPNAYDTQHISKMAKEPLEPWAEKIFTRPTLITSGRLTTAKGQWHMLRFFKKIRSSRKDVALVFLGVGELKPYLTRLSLELGFRTFSGPLPPPDNEFDVYFLGYQSNPYKFLSKATIFIFTSLWEGFPNAVIEAMASGVCVASADCDSGPREILAPDTPFGQRTAEPDLADHGILMPALSGLRRNASTGLESAEDMWAETLLSLLDDPATRDNYAQTGIERAADFEISKVTALWKDALHAQTHD